MANIPLKSIKFPDLADTYTVPSNAGELPYNKSATYPADTVGKALQDKPDADGTIANAEQLTSNIYEEDNIPYNFRTSGGSIDIGDRETDMLVGGTVGWNQLVDTGMTSVTVTSGHKYRARINSVESIGASTGTAISLNDATKDNVTDLTQMFGSAIADYIYSLEQATAGAGVAWFRKLFPKPYYAYNAGELMSVQASSHDMVGFNQWDEEWETGGISNANGQFANDPAHFRSKNYIRVLPNTSYCFTHLGNALTNFLYFYWYDADKNFISYGNVSGVASVHTSPSNACYMRFRNGGNGDNPTYKNDICINISWDGERDGEYEAYVKHSYPLDDSLTLRGIPKLDANNNLYYDGDTYESDGTVTRKYGVVDLGTLSWTYAGSGDNKYFSASVAGGLAVTGRTTPFYVCSKYIAVEPKTTANLQNGQICRTVNAESKYFIKDSNYTDKDTFTAAMDGVYLVYELATPTTETADPYTNPQIVDDFGTEEYVDYAVSQGDRDVSIPVGHYTEYMANLKAKLEMSPNSPEGAGDYIVRQTNGENEYVTLASNATIQDIIARLEALENAES